MYPGWFDLHPVVSFLIINLRGVITLTTLVWTVRTFLKENQQKEMYLGLNSQIHLFLLILSFFRPILESSV